MGISVHPDIWFKISNSPDKAWINVTPSLGDSSTQSIKDVSVFLMK
jgi:hypothetical protein